MNNKIVLSLLTGTAFVLSFLAIQTNPIYSQDAVESVNSTMSEMISNATDVMSNATEMISNATDVMSNATDVVSGQVSGANPRF